MSILVWLLLKQRPPLIVSVFFIIVGFIVPVLTLPLGTAILNDRAKRSSRRLRRGQCVRCGYPCSNQALQVGATCPECGWRFTEEDRLADQRWRADRFGMAKPRPDGLLYDD